MASTPNFNWSTPDNTGLVKNGALDIRTLGNSIDASLVDLKGGTTGQVLAKASGTDMDFSWVAQDDSNAIQNAIVDAKGDLIGATAADTPARLAVGTNGQVLTADSTAATGLAWATPAAGAMTLIRRSTFTNVAGTGTTFDGVFTTTYKTFLVVLERVFSVSAQTDDLQMQLRTNVPATKTANYYGNLMTTPYNSGSSTFTQQSATAQFTLALTIGEGNYPSSASITFARVSDGAYRSVWYGQGQSGATDQAVTVFGGFNDDVASYAGFLLKGSSANISGEVAVYGLAI